MTIEPEKIETKYQMMNLIIEIFEKSNINLREFDETLKELKDYYNLDLYL